MEQVRRKLNKFYEKVDPWGYMKNPDDLLRKSIILEKLSKYGEFDKALDIGCGEGWITKDLPARAIYGNDISDTAMSRIPDSILKMDMDHLDSYIYKFDLIIATGVLYKHYDYEWILKIINKLAIGIVLTCNIVESEISDIHDYLRNQILVEEFPYRGMVERLRIFNYGGYK